ncbi:hypothetical protein CRUP_010992 [Coryphaenoides rupestris]|nr:hypothetical protein CRUP_010992 [Coryphaenoides rupestris]
MYNMIDMTGSVVLGQTRPDQDQGKHHRAAAMLTLASKLKREDGGKPGRAPATSDSTSRRSGSPPTQ